MNNEEEQYDSIRTRVIQAVRRATKENSSWLYWEPDANLDAWEWMCSTLGENPSYDIPIELEYDVMQIMLSELRKLDKDHLTRLWEGAECEDWRFYPDNDDVDQAGNPSEPHFDAMRSQTAEKLWGVLLRQAEEEGTDAINRQMELEGVWKEPREMLKDLFGFMRCQGALPSRSPAEIAKIAQWMHIFQCVPDLWPRAQLALTVRGNNDGRWNAEFEYTEQNLSITITQFESEDDVSDPWVDDFCATPAGPRATFLT